jgi:hypothetical protein
MVGVEACPDRNGNPERVSTVINNGPRVGAVISQPDWHINAAATLYVNDAPVWYVIIATNSAKSEPQYVVSTVNLEAVQPDGSVSYWNSGHYFNDSVMAWQHFVSQTAGSMDNLTNPERA